MTKTKHPNVPSFTLGILNSARILLILVTTVLCDSGLARNPSARIENSAEGESQWGRLSKTRLSFLAFHWFRGVSVAYDIIPPVQWNERIQPMASADEVEVLQVFQINWVN